MLSVIAFDSGDTYPDGQKPVVHLECDLRATVKWANRKRRRWAFTLSSAGAADFEDRSDLADLREIDWASVRKKNWFQQPDVKHGKQAEFLLERSFPWSLVERIGVRTKGTYKKVVGVMEAANCRHTPTVEIRREWYYD